jgi:DNA-binding SARP family transcriptional activator/Tfp pilus assembly protein PilF
MRFNVLGPVEIEVDGTVLTLRRRQTRCLLGVLLLDVNRRVPVDRLATLLWEGDPPEHSRRIIQDHVWRIRTTLATTTEHACQLVTVGDGYRLDAPPETVDAHRFRTLVESATAITDPAERADQRRRALDLWRGPVLDQAASGWLRERLCTELEELRLAAWEDLVADSLTLGRERAVLPELARLAAAQPTRERLVDLYMQALHRVGRKAEALEVYARTRARLADELGIDPGPALRERHRAILRDDTPEPPAPDPAATIVPRQLPATVGQFVGRSRELAALAQTPDASTVVIAAIDGMAGVGKTALALHAAHRIADRYPDGQLFIDLRGYTQGMEPTEPAEALDHALRALGVPGPQVPASLDQAAALYRTRLAGRRMLILLDNAATEAQVTPLLPGSAGCLVLVTSRRRLAGLDHAHTVSLDTLPAADAVALFCQAAGEHRLDGQPPELLVELVELCGRLPLAIRIAAARLRSHPAWQLTHLVARLRDQQHRLGELEMGHRSVTAALDLSYQHLSPDQRQTYRLLGLHPGPDLDAHAAAALLGSTLRHAGRMLDQLLEVHLLLETVAGRYRFHDLTRVHAAHTATRDQSASAGVDRLLDYYRHAASLAMDAAYPYEWERRPQLPPGGLSTPELPDPAAALGWLDTELPNLLAVARCATEYGKPAYVLHLSSILHRHLRTRGRYHDAETLHQQALVAARATGDQAAEVVALTGLGYTHRRQGRYEQATDHFEQALQIARGTGHRVGEMEALTGLGHIHWQQGQSELATHQYQRALQIARTIGHRDGERDALSGLGHIHTTQGRYEQATDHLEQALRLARITGHHMGELGALTGLGYIDRLQGRYEQAIERHQQALRLARTAGHRVGELAALGGLGYIYRMQGRYEQSANAYQQLLQLAQDSRERNLEFEAWQGLGRLQHAIGNPELAITHHHRARALADELDQPTDRARAHDGLAHAHHALHQPEQARGHWQQALSILTGLGVEHTEDKETTVTAIRAHLNRLGQRRTTVR